MLVAALLVGGVLHRLAQRDGWMSFNVGLAVAPVALAVLLFFVRRRGGLWWIGVATFLLLLPNTPYLLTDVVHLHDSVAGARGAGGSGATTAAAYLALFAVGVIGYAFVLALIVADLRRQGRRRLIPAVLLAVNAACAVGVWLGRVQRLNSWDAASPGKVTKALVGAADPRAGAAILLVFVVVGAAALSLLVVADRAARHVGPGRFDWGDRPPPP